MNIRTCVAVVLAAFIGVSGAGIPASVAQEYPTKNVTLVIPFPPGGSTDLVGRLLAKHLGDAWKRTVVVENRPGGNGMLGPTAVAKARPDGYTLLLAAPSVATAKATMKVMPIDPMKDLAPVSQLIEVPYVISVNAQVPVKSLKELIGLAKASPGKLNYGWFAVGSRLTSEFFANAAGVKLTAVGYRGEALMMAALAAGEVQVGLATPVNVLEFQAKGQIRALAVTGDKRMEKLKDVPTTAEAGVAEFNTRVWFGLFAPGRTPLDIRKKIAAEVANYAKNPEVIARLGAAGFEAKASSPEELGSLLARETERAIKLGELIKLKKQ